MKRFVLLLCLGLWVAWLPTVDAFAAKGDQKAKKKAQDEAQAEQEGPLSAGTFSGLALRGIGPALTSGRVSDLAVDPENRHRFYVAVASGGLFYTENGGTTFTPIFDDQASYSIGVVTLDPNNSLTVWVGTGENNSQRSVSYGDGVYKSVDGGKTWENMGLKESEHIGRIVVDPRDSDVVYVAAQGPLWRAGGDRGLYKTTDGGETWERILHVDEHTGASDLWMDPRDPDVLYAATYQRRRRVWTLINGGPGSGIHKSTDGGKTWTELTRGLPQEDMGRIGLAMAPADPDVLYAIIEASGEGQGFYRSTDAGSNWEKRSGYVSNSPQYYNELIPDPVNVDRVYSMDTFMMVTDDGGASFRQAGQSSKHVDDHALWIDPQNTDYLLSGCDGGLYESFDRGKTWSFFANLPITQFYKIAVDNDLPFYNVYGGTQDNNTLGGPSRTRTTNGVTNREWFVTLGGDGFEPAVDPDNPDIVYSQWQYGNLARFDRRTGEIIDIQPQPAPGDDPPRWNWDSALLLSPHSPKRLYFASQRVYRTDDRGNSWQPVSGDLTRQLDRNELPVMGKVWSVDAVAKNRSTSVFGNIVALAESPRVEGLLYAGTDDGLVQVLEPGAEEWRRVESFGGVPAADPVGPYVADLVASQHDDDTVYAALNRHKDGDFRPYLAKSTDRGATWSLISGDLPERGSMWAVAEDPQDPSLLFAGTEFGVFFSLDGGQQWTQLKGGIPTIAVRDLEIQTREQDLVVGTFGRGIYILDDYSALRGLEEASLEQDALIFAPRRTWMYMPSAPLSLDGKAFLGDNFYTADNPSFGALLTYYLKDGLKTLEEQRQEQEKEMEEAGESVSYPTWDDLRAEDREADPVVLLTIKDEEGNVVRTLTGGGGKGFQRVAWDLRFPSAEPVDLNPGERPFWIEDPIGPMVVPGTYTVELAKRQGGELVALAGPVSFEAVPVGVATLPADDQDALFSFQRKTARLQRAVLGARQAAEEAQSRLDHLRAAILATPEAELALLDRQEALAVRLDDLLIDLRGDRTVAQRNEAVSPSITERVARIVSGHWTSTSAPTQTQMDSYEAAAAAFGDNLAGLRTLMEEDLVALEDDLEAAGAPWTPGRLPTWSPE
ncbi:MAG: glycosyl hydrolase [Acidobacteriota bacterium]|nr:glycosyl hydrolase [Acidobacteriota bacterium]